MVGKLRNMSFEQLVRKDNVKCKAMLNVSTRKYLKGILKNVKRKINFPS